MARLTQSGVPCPSEPSARGPLCPRRALHRPQPSATLLSGRPRRADAQLPAAASSAPRPQRCLRPPEPPLAPSLMDIRAPGAAGRTVPRSSPGTGASHRPGALLDHRARLRRPPRAPRSQLALTTRAKRTALSSPRGARVRQDPPFRGRRGGMARLLLRAVRSTDSAFSPAVEAPAPGTPALLVGPRRPGAAGCAGSRQPNTALAASGCCH